MKVTWSSVAIVAFYKVRYELLYMAMNLET